MRVAICFSQFGPYHHARVDALRRLAPDWSITGVQIAAASRTYAWAVDDASSENLVTLCAGAEEDVSFAAVFLPAWRFWKRERIQSAFLPSYAPASSLALLLSARLAGVKCIMMNESHAGTERAKGLKQRLKRFLVSLFHGAIVGGEPHRRHFESLGMRPDRIVTGYDAIDNAHFARAAAEARANEDALRAKLHLPENYVLSLGRMVEKKNLITLVDAFAKVKMARPSTGLKLVFVGSGDCQAELIERCGHHRLTHGLTSGDEPSAADVLFYGFRQIDENPVFYALAEAFVLPSLHEEWGLVVNEAMACGLPVIVSAKVGSAEDLVIPGMNGYHFDPISATDLAKHILYLHENSEERARMGAASLERIRNWGCENFAEKAVRIVERVVQTRSPRNETTTEEQDAGG